jgi:formylglycine-generating enzyme required for sulfatase activity
MELPHFAQCVKPGSYFVSVPSVQDGIPTEDRGNEDHPKNPWVHPADSALSQTCQVDLYEANPLGIFGMHGNVWEWCEDMYDSSRRVVRGSSWSSGAEGCRAAYRGWSTPEDGYFDLGLRLVRVPSSS